MFFRPWLSVVRMMGHATSIVTTLVLVVVVARHSKLWTQYYLLLTFAGLAYALGCVFMIVSDLDVVRNDRHINIAVSGIHSVSAIREIHFRFRVQFRSFSHKSLAKFL